ncbi:unnamed protein product [Chrysodeixis includens]|uniref:Thioredoxin-like fold domain-containing protein n=1 Tax=Chrysodeixis includens TaxID=689277 RepID=A0A9P0FWH6_CHRIL|nr:unnamed protein product [Chrysodeixis includens]
MDSISNPAKYKPVEWMNNCKMYNKNYEKVPCTFLTENVDVICLYFSLKDKDRVGNEIMQDFYEIYENAKYVNIPIEVLNVPMDDTKDAMCISFDDQANWFTLMFNDPLIIFLKYMYDITAVPHIIVLKTDGSVISSHGILDLDEYGKNALITWLSASATTKSEKRLSKERNMYGLKWRFLTLGVGKADKPNYRRKFSIMPVEEHLTSIGMSVQTDTSSSDFSEI